MISLLRGKVSFKFFQAVEILTNNIGFRVLVPQPLLLSLPLGKEITLYTKMVVGEKVLALYGFASREDGDIFETLTSVSGVGPKTALQIFNERSGREIREAIDRADVAFFAAIKGIGQKTAQRLIVDLRSILDREKLAAQKRRKEEAGLVYEALVQLGFKAGEIESVLPHLPKEASDEEKITVALSLLSEKNEEK